MQGREAVLRHTIVTYHLKSITNKLNQELGSSWAYSAYSPCTGCECRTKGVQNNPKCLKKPTAIYTNPKMTNASYVSPTSFFVTCRRENTVNGKVKKEPSVLSYPTLTQQREQARRSPLF